jgi:hypothetical protein
MWLWCCGEEEKEEEEEKNHGLVLAWLPHWTWWEMAAGVAMAAMPAVAAATAAAAEMEEDHNYHLVLPAWFMDQAVVTITTILPETTTTRLMLKDCY